MSEKGKLSKFWITELTRPAFEDWLEHEKHPVVVIGIGSIEQHGPHLPLGMDSMAVKRYIHEVAKRSNSVAVHPCWPGFSPHHLGFKGTVTFSWDTLMGVLMDTIGSLALHGVKRFVIMNGHGGNRNIMNLVVQLAKREYGVMVAAPSGPGDTELAKVFADRQKRLWDVHSGINETGAALYMFPELVEMDRVPKDWTPTLDVDPKLREFLDPDRDDYEVVSQVRGACSQPDTDDFSADGIYGLGSPRDADPEEYAKRFEERVEFVAEFIREWKKIPTPPAFQG
jgi:creatinine amidohydrolase